MGTRTGFDGAAPHWTTVRLRVQALGDLLTAGPIDPLTLGKTYAAVALSLSEAAAGEGAQSPRFDAAARALDLRTKRSVLEAFLREE